MNGAFGGGFTPPSTGGGGGVSSVSATSPLASSGGANPNISLSAGSGTGELLTWGGASWSAETLNIENEVWVAKDGSDATGDGSVSAPFASVGAAMAAITTASPTTRWVIRLGPGRYTEAGPIALKANVFLIGHHRLSTIVTSTGGWALDASFTPAGDHRSGAVGLTMIGTCTFDFSAVSSNDGKLYFDSCIFQNDVSLTGFGVTQVNQGEMIDCDLRGNLTLSGVSWYTVGCIHRSLQQIYLNQHSGNPTLLSATGGYADKITLTSTVDNFDRRCSLFSRSFWTDDLEVDGIQSYADLTIDSVPRYGIVTLNNGQVINLNPLILAASSQGLRPDTTENRYLGDFGLQWLFNFNYVNISTGTPLYLTTTTASYAPNASETGYPVYIIPDIYGVAENVDSGFILIETAVTTGTGSSGDIVAQTGTTVDGDSGNITLFTATPTGTGTRGNIFLSAQEVDASSSPLLHKWQSGVTGDRPSGLGPDDVGRTYFDTTIGLPIWWNGSGWIDAAGVARP